MDGGVIKVENQIGWFVFGSDHFPPHTTNEASTYVLVLVEEWRSGTDMLAQSFRNNSLYRYQIPMQVHGSVQTLKVQSVLSSQFR